MEQAEDLIYCCDGEGHFTYLNPAAARILKYEPDELIGQIRDLTKALLAYGARMPKELMLFVKNMMFLDGAIATLAPDLDIFAELEAISLTFAEKHGQQIMSQLGLEHQADWEPNLAGVKASFGVEDSVESLTHREVLARRAQIRDKFQGQRPSLSPRRTRRPEVSPRSRPPRACRDS